MANASNMNENELSARTVCQMYGAFEHKIDAQRRVAVPSEWRDETDDGVFFVIPGKDATLQIYTSEVFNAKIMPRITKLSPVKSEDLRTARRLMSLTCKCVCDRQGRIQISQQLMDYARLGEKVAIVGSGDFGQIMSAARWTEEQKFFSADGDGFLDILA